MRKRKMEMYRLPVRAEQKARWTKSAQKMSREWRALGKALEDLTDGDYQMFAFDPGILFRYKNTPFSVNLPTDILFRIQDILRKKKSG